MGRQIIKQPNGKYCIFSGIVDSITHYHMEEQDIINEWVEESKLAKFRLSDVSKSFYCLGDSFGENGKCDKQCDDCRAKVLKQ